MRLPNHGGVYVALGVSVVLAGAIVPAQISTVPIPDDRETDPVTIGWMVGAPPSEDKLIRFSDGSWFQFPRTRWSFSNIRQLMPTSVVRRSTAGAATLPRAERSDIDDVTFQPIGQSGSMTWAQSLAANYTDGILVLYRGQVVYERYFGALAVDRQHLAFSVTEIVCGDHSGDNDCWRYPRRSANSRELCARVAI